jgi:hypothetical protein
MAGAEFTHLLSSPRSNTGVCHNRNNPSANLSQVHCGLPSSVLRWQRIYAARYGLWQSTLKRLLIVAIHILVILVVAIHGLNTVDGHNPWYILYLRAELSK